ncbi:MAG: hypothetical protein CSA29_00780 [Desulfobacterales bacterium]|nr:MAG: hypothetical protein CSA29_00780 [Desulfobacterales bacterium]
MTTVRCIISLIVAAPIILSAIFASAESSAPQPNPFLTQRTASRFLKVISDKMIAEQNAGVVEFIGNVKATQQDSTLVADSVRIFLKASESKQDNLSNIKKMVATGNVEYTAGDRKAMADKAVYTIADEVLVLTGKAPKLLTGNSWISGKKITLFRLDGRVMVESDRTKRVQAVFDAQDQKRP